MHADTRVRLDVHLNALAHVKRRRVLFALRRERSGASGRETAEVEVGKPSDGAATVSGVDVYHNHLPKLADLGFVSWESGSDVVRAGPRFDEIEPLLALLDDNEDELPDDWL